MAPFLQRYRLEKSLYLATGALLVLGVLAYVASFLRTEWAVDNPVMPFCIISVAGAVLILAVAVAASAVRIFQEDHPEVSELLDPLGLLVDPPRRIRVRPPGPSGQPRRLRSGGLRASLLLVVPLVLPEVQGTLDPLHALGEHGLRGVQDRPLLLGVTLEERLSGALGDLERDLGR